MKQYSTREAAKKLGLSLLSIQRYIAAGKIPVPPVLNVGGGKLRIWTDPDIEKVREVLPKIANGRKTRYSKLREKQKPQPKAVPHKTRKKKKTE
jgi:predicted DNA-binding transcriptional regulator AlpA